MIQTLADALNLWRNDPAVHLVIIEAVPGRAFCAGGDIRTIRNWILDGDDDRIDAFFREEYALNLAIAHYPKPYVALINGIWMGGGVGVSVHGAYRVVSDQSQFGMPEVQVGMFPDVGASFVLPRLRGQFGLYLGLTGVQVGAADACWLGLATHYVEQNAFGGLADALAEHGLAALTAAAQTPPPGQLAALAGRVDAVFSLPTLDAIVAALEAGDDEWSRQTRAALATASPSALRWTFELLRAGANRTFEQCQRAELEFTRIATRHPDFPEGVRALVVDKDRKPLWQLLPQ